MIHKDTNQLSCSHPLYCDNQGLVDRVIKLSEFPMIFPNTTFEPEWDCLAQILDALQFLQQAAPTLHHVKGHQDDDTPYEQLSLPAQLNCDADAFAEVRIQTQPLSHHYTTAHVFPAGECILTLPNRTITQDIKLELATARNLPPLQDKIQYDAGWWDPAVSELVDWQAHGKALHRHNSKRPTYAKYIHQILPLGKRTHRYDPKYPPNCSTCAEPLEDTDHFWKCWNVKGIEWR